MKRRDFMKYVLVGGITTQSLAQRAFPMVRNSEDNEAAQTSKKRPNIIVIMADDMGFSDLGCYGGEIDTPNIDRLAAEGMRFSQFYNCAVCGPSRSSLLSGLYNDQAAKKLRSLVICKIMGVNQLDRQFDLDVPDVLYGSPEKLKEFFDFMKSCV